MSKHEWSDERLNLPMAAVAAFVDIEPGVSASFDSLWTRYPSSGWTCDGGQSAAREILRLAARVAELEALAEEDDESLMNAGLYLGEVALRNDALEAIIAPLLPLFRARDAHRAERDASNVQMGASPVTWPDTITLTAEFPVEALRALTKE